MGARQRRALMGKRDPVNLRKHRVNIRRVIASLCPSLLQFIGCGLNSDVLQLLRRRPRTQIRLPAPLSPIRVA